MRRALDIAAVILVLARLGLAQDAASSEQEMIRLLGQQVKELQQKVTALEARSGSSATASAEVPPQPADETSDVAPARDLLPHKLEGIQWRGFAEANYKVLNQRQPEIAAFGFMPGSAGNFYSGDFDLLLTSRINDKASLLAEIVFGEGDGQSFNADLDRLLMKYNYNDHLKISVGRYHTGIGHYNATFHSGTWLQTTADRPLVMGLSNDGGLLPTQAIGMSVTGAVPSGGLGLNYVVEYRSSDTSRPELDGSGPPDDEDNGNHINVGFFARPERWRGLQVGGSFHHDKISALKLGPQVRLCQTLVNGYVVYNGHGVEFMSEGFLIRHAFEHSNVRLNMLAFYSQISKKFGAIRPFVRYQYVNANVDSIFEDMLLRHGPSFGVRYEINEDMAFKAQFDHTLRKERLAYAAGSDILRQEERMKPHSTILLLMISLASLVYALPAQAQNGDMAVVVNAKNSVNNLTVAELRNLFTGYKNSWPGGTAVKLFVRASSTAERTALLKLLGMSEGEYKQYWISQVFRGEAQAQPLALPSNGMQKEAVAALPGGIALMDVQDVKPGMKVVRVNGRLPGETGYPLH